MTVKTRPCRILIFGAGAVGAFYGSRLATVEGVEVSVVCRSNYDKVKEQGGFKVQSPEPGYGGEWFFRPKEVYKQGSGDIGKTKWDYIVVSTKALPDVTDDSASLQGLLSSHTAIVLVQNGVGVEEPYRARFPEQIILSGVTVVSAAQPEHGLIVHNRWTRISIGPYCEGGGPEAESQRSSEALVALLHKGGIKDAEGLDHASLQLVRWHKIAINAAMNPSSVLSNGTPNGHMVKDEELYHHLKGVMDEVLTTAPKILGKPFPAKLATSDKILASTAKNQTGSKPSMLLDWESGKRMELEVILGNPLRIARRHGHDMPRCQSMYALLKKAQDNRDAKSRL